VAESAAVKGRRLLAEGRLIVTKVDGDVIEAACRGDSAEWYTLRYDPEGHRWSCSCAELKGKCSHLVALQLVTIRRRPG
jgi:uncharacterized Zn finger protein